MIARRYARSITVDGGMDGSSVVSQKVKSAAHGVMAPLRSDAQPLRRGLVIQPAEDSVASESVAVNGPEVRVVRGGGPERLTEPLVTRTNCGRLTGWQMQQEK